MSYLTFGNPDDMKRPETAFLFRQFLDYVRSEAFRPKGSMTLGQALGLFRLRGIHSFFL